MFSGAGTGSHAFWLSLCNLLQPTEEDVSYDESTFTYIYKCQNALTLWKAALIAVIFRF